MEFFYYCATCIHHRHNIPPRGHYLPDTLKWCVKHERKIDTDFFNEHSICGYFEHKDPLAKAYQSSIRLFPEGELWSFTLYLPCRKLANIADLPKIDVVTGDVIE